MGVGNVVAEMLPAAVVVALSPFPIIAIVLILAGTRPRSSGLGFLVGWAGGLGLLAGAILLLSGLATGAGADRGLLAALLQLGLGAAFMGWGVVKWLQRPGPDDEAKQPAWMASLTGMPAPRALLLGLLLAAANPKIIVLTLAAVTSIIEAGLAPADAALAAGIYVLLGSLVVLVAVLAFLVAPGPAAGPLDRTRDLMVRHGSVIGIVVLLVLGAKLVGDGVTALLG